MSSRYKQIEELWRIAISFNRKIIVVNTPSPEHYGNLLIDMCSIFTLPQEISCLNLPTSTIIIERECIMTDAVPKIPAKAFNLTTQYANIDFKNAECVVGYITGTAWKYSGKRSKKTFPVKEVSTTFQQLLPSIKAAIGKAVYTVLKLYVYIYARI